LLEDGVQVVNEISVADKTGRACDLVSVDKLSDLLSGDADVERGEASLKL
jgi:hypothetical protein